MSAERSPTPPLDIEQWLDFIIASAAHRSHNAGQQKFGDTLIQRYFVSLPDRYKDDAVATFYFDHMLCAVGAAVRGFSVVRDTFQSNWDSIKAEREAALKRTEGLQAFSPLSKEGVWGKVIASATGLGLGAPLIEAAKAKHGQAPLVSILIIVACIGVGIIGLEAFVEWLRGRNAKRIEKQFPADVLMYWEQRSLLGYRMVLKQFLPIATEITNRSYPGAANSSLSDQEINALIEKHFAFKAREVAPLVDQETSPIVSS